MSTNEPSHRALDIIARIVADGLLVTAALIAAVSGRAVQGYIRLENAVDREQFMEWSAWLFSVNVGIVVAITIATFALMGFYTRRRTYTRRYKILSFLQASGIAGLAYVTLVFLIDRTWLLPRSVVLATFVLVFLFCGGIRYLKWSLEERLLRTPEKQHEPERHGPETVLVIGGAGHLGSVICRQLLDSGYRVRVLDMLMFGPDAIADLLENPNFELVRGDFRHVEMVVKASKGADSMIHLGAIVGDPACAVDEEYSTDVNFAATRMIREVCRGFGIRRFIFASTCSVYGASDDILDEHSSLNPVSLYARTKIDSESALLALHDDTFSPTILRLATVFGLSPRPRFDLVVNIVTAMAVKEGQCKIFGGSQWRPFIHVSDVARGVLAVLKAPEETVAGRVYNVGDDRLNMQLSEVGDLIEELIPEATVIRDESNVDRRNYRVSFKRIYEELGFRCERTVRDGVEEIKAAIQSGAIEDFRAPQYSNFDYMKRLREAGHPSTKRLTETGKLVALRTSNG